MGSPNLENKGAKECYQIVKSSDLESIHLTMPSFLLLQYGQHTVNLQYAIVNLVGFRFNCVFRRTGCCYEMESVITLHFWENSYFSSLL